MGQRMSADVLDHEQVLRHSPWNIRLPLHQINVEIIPLILSKVLSLQIRFSFSPVHIEVEHIKPY